MTALILTATLTCSPRYLLRPIGMGTRSKSVVKQGDPEEPGSVSTVWNILVRSDEAPITPFSEIASLSGVPKGCCRMRRPSPLSGMRGDCGSSIHLRKTAARSNVALPIGWSPVSPRPLVVHSPVPQIRRSTYCGPRARLGLGGTSFLRR